MQLPPAGTVACAKEDLGPDQVQLLFPDFQETAEETRMGDDAKALYKLGRTLRRVTEDLYEVYLLRYDIEDPEVAGKIWEVVYEQKKDMEDEDACEKPTWFAKVRPRDKMACSRRKASMKKRVTFEDN
uniref:Uncharacterized protein n=1 Tax=Alexandrium catenella TaxID=2925 RepID=A0A7S1QGG6_ALECA|mmetsp:Transcript_29848/g.80826  ORF Transcript_29848/g.80826 Transcript_29848/m.80826 type:complete len:128 (+) Transcript_29848:34-417(+)